MLVFIISIVLIILLAYLCCKFYDDVFYYFLMALLVIIVGINGLFIVGCLYDHITYPQYVEKYNALISKVEIYKDNLNDNFNFQNLSVFEEVEDWNTHIAYFKAYYNNLWIGMYVDDRYADLDYIDYNIELK